jgi:rRNA maturation endonuclease Nob1
MSIKDVFTMDSEKAFEIFDCPVQCGDCYGWYDLNKSEECPVCGSTEIVGDR